MSEDLGKIQKPSAEEVILKRKIYLVQNIQNYFPENKEFVSLLKDYWISISGQLEKLEKTAGTISYIYIEGMWQSLTETKKVIKESNPMSYEFISGIADASSEYKPIEDEQIYKTLIDWTRIAQIGFISEDVKKIVEDNYSKIIDIRQKHIESEVNKLETGEAGLFIISSGNHKFPEDIELFNIIPPELDKINRWIQDNQESISSESQEKAEKHEDNEGESGKESGLWTPQ
tara:strand:+ start:2005 stop:2697 length:693 start_codon:yes stop_codon:yes gene_type:complete